eukprot:357706_1
MDEDDETLNDNRWITTTIMTGVAEACCDSFLSCAPRVVQPMYRVFIQGTTEVLGSIYDVIQKRKGKITGDCIVEGTNLFDIYALLPVVQSFGFCDELRTETAGMWCHNSRSVIGALLMKIRCGFQLRSRSKKNMEILVIGNRIAPSTKWTSIITSKA